MDHLLKTRPGQWCVLVAAVLAVALGILVHWVVGVAAGTVAGTAIGVVLEYLELRAARRLVLDPLKFTSSSKIADGKPQVAAGSLSYGTPAVGSPTLMQAWAPPSQGPEQSSGPESIGAQASEPVLLEEFEDNSALSPIQATSALSPVQASSMLSAGQSSEALAVTLSSSRRLSSVEQRDRARSGKRYTMARVPVIAPAAPLEPWQDDASSVAESRPDTSAAPLAADVQARRAFALQ